jgi:hypothetical protein
MPNINPAFFRALSTVIDKEHRELSRFDPEFDKWTKGMNDIELADYLDFMQRYNWHLTRGGHDEVLTREQFYAWLTTEDYNKPRRYYFGPLKQLFDDEK